MTLYSIDGKRQDEIGRKEHWKEFVKFKGCSLHQQLVEEISLLVKGSDKLNSMFAGKKILTKISKNNELLLGKYGQRELGSLFGMTLWHWLAIHDEEWFFYRDSKSENEEIAGMIYFQSQD